MSRGTSSSNRWFVGLALVLAGALGWSLVASGGDAEPVSDEATIDADDDSTNDDSTDEDGAEDDGADEAPASDGDTQDDDEGEDDSTSTERSSVDPPSTVVDGNDDAVSGEQAEAGTSAATFPGSGLTLVAGNPMQLIDLETGAVTKTSLRGDPVALIDSHLIMRDQNRGRFMAVRVDDLDGEPVWLGPDTSNGYAYGIDPGDDAGTAWMTTESWSADGTESQRLQSLVDLETGDVLDERELDAYDLFWSFGLLGENRFTSPRSGGVYEADGDGFRFVADGRIVAVGEDAMIIETCDEQLRCTTTWRPTESPDVVLDLPVPPDVADGFIAANDRLLAYTTRGSWRFTVFDVERATVLVDDLDYQGTLPISVSADGRYIAFNRNGVATVLEVETQAEVEVDSGFLSGGVLLINTP